LHLTPIKVGTNQKGAFDDVRPLPNIKHGRTWGVEWSLGKEFLALTMACAVKRQTQSADGRWLKSHGFGATSNHVQNETAPADRCHAPDLRCAGGV